MNRHRLLGCLGVFVCLAAVVAFAAPVTFAQNYTIDVQSGGPGTVSPSGSVVVPAGGTQTFTFTPSGCYGVGEVTVDDVPVGIGITEYTFTNVQSDHVLYVPFGPRFTATALDVRPAIGQCAVPETLTATLTNADGGDVQFFNGTTLLGTRTLASGVATYIVAPGLIAGSYSLSASYVGTTCSAPSTSPTVVYHVVDTGPVPVTLTLTVNQQNADALLSATLWLGGAVFNTQSGSVVYYDNGGVIGGAIPMMDGYASPRLFVLGLGVHVITAKAYPSPCVGTVTSQPETLNVYPFTQTSMSLSLSPPIVAFGGSVTLTAVITPPNAEGLIRFLDMTNSGVQVGSAPLVNGVATFTYKPLSSYMVMASYEGGGGYTPCISNRAFLEIGTPPPPLFSPPYQSYSTSGTPYSVAIADLNADGRPDLVTANLQANTASVLLGNGDGTFGPRTDFGTGSNPSSVAIADLNADARPDLALATDSGVSVLLGNGNGTFGSKNDFGFGCNGVAIGDLNADGRPDLAVVYPDPPGVSVLLGNGDGTFRRYTDYGTGDHPASVAIADVTGDGSLDLVVADASYGGGLTVLFGNGDGTFGYPSTLGTGEDPPWVAIGDLNADGRPDLAAVNYGSAAKGNTVSVLLGSGGGVFGPKTDFDTEFSPNSVAIGDLNADGRPDLAVAYASPFSPTGVSVLLGKGDGTFGPRTDYADGVYYSVAIGDLNADGRPDLAVSGNPHRVTVLLNTDIPTATLLAQFDATPGPDGIELRWSFGDASRVSSATVERSPAAFGPWVLIAPEFLHDADGTAALDRTTKPGETYFYRLNVSLVDGSSATFGPISSTGSASIGESTVNLGSNPARGASQIQYAVARAGHVRLEVADIAGRVVTTLFDGVQPPGRFHVAWDGTNRGDRMPAGLYFVRLTTLDRTVARKLTLLP